MRLLSIEEGTEALTFEKVEHRAKLGSSGGGHSLVVSR